MQTLTIQVKDDFMSEVIRFIEKSKDNIKITKDKNLELDPYFYDRRKKLHKIRDGIKNREVEMLTQIEYEKEVEEFFKKLAD